MPLPQGPHHPYNEINAFLLIYCEDEGLSPEAFYDPRVKAALKDGDGIDTHRAINFYEHAPQNVAKLRDDPMTKLQFFRIIEMFGKECFKE
jgi:hypothetical protein